MNELELAVGRKSAAQRIHQDMAGFVKPFGLKMEDIAVAMEIAGVEFSSAQAYLAEQQYLDDSDFWKATVGGAA